MNISMAFLEEEYILFYALTCFEKVIFPLIQFCLIVSLLVAVNYYELLPEL